MLKKMCQNCTYFKLRVYKGQYNAYCLRVADYIYLLDDACGDYNWKPVKPLKGPWKNESRVR